MKPYALITGASKGIGHAIAHELAQKSYNLLLVARSGDVLERLKIELVSAYGIDVQTLVMDLSLPDAAQQVKQWYESQEFPIAILVNNAGYGLGGKFDSLPLADQINMLQLNMLTLTALTYDVLPLLKKQPKAYILNVSSTAAYQAVPGLALYSASKVFVLSFTRAIRFELRKTSVSVSSLNPGPVDTDFAKRAGLEMLTKMAQKFDMRPDIVAKIAVAGMFNRKAEIIPGFSNKLTAFGSRLLPKILLERIAAKIYKID